MSLLPTDPSSLSTLLPPKPPATKEQSQESPGSQEILVPAVYHCCVPRWPHYTIGAIAGTAFTGMRLHVFLSSCLTKPRTCTGHRYHVAHSVHIPSKMIRHTSTTLSVCITTRASCMWDMPRCHSHIGSTAEEAPF